MHEKQIIRVLTDRGILMFGLFGVLNFFVVCKRSYGSSISDQSGPSEVAEGIPKRQFLLEVVCVALFDVGDAVSVKRNAPIAHVVPASLLQYVPRPDECFYPDGRSWTHLFAMSHPPTPPIARWLGVPRLSEMVELSSNPAEASLYGLLCLATERARAGVGKLGRTAGQQDGVADPDAR